MLIRVVSKEGFGKDFTVRDRDRVERKLVLET